MNILTTAAAAELRDGIILMISRWSALQEAFREGHCGRNPQKRSEQIVEDLFNLLTKSKDRVYLENVEDMLDDFMDTLGIDAEDGSIEEIAYKLMVMHEECLEGNFESIRRLKETETRRNDESVMEVDGSEEDDVQQSGMEVDDDGFTPVVSRHNKGKSRRRRTTTKP